MEHLNKIDIGNIFLRIQFRNDADWRYRRTYDQPRPQGFAEHFEKVALEHFKTDPRFTDIVKPNLFQYCISYYRHNDKEDSFFLYYQVGLGRRNDASCTDDEQAISCCIKLSDEDIKLVLELLK